MGSSHIPIFNFKRLRLALYSELIHAWTVLPQRMICFAVQLFSIILLNSRYSVIAWRDSSVAEMTSLPSSTAGLRSIRCGNRYHIIALAEFKPFSSKVDGHI